MNRTDGVAMVDGARMLFLCIRTLLLVACLSALPCAQGVPVAAAAETQSEAALTTSVAYDVVTIRPNHQGPGSVSVSTNLDLYRATNVGLVDLLRDAYDLRPGQLEGKPKWADDDRFDIIGKTLDVPVEVLRELTPDDRRRMLRGILADRFQLRTHRETRMMPVDDLLLANGHTPLQPTSGDGRKERFHGVSAGGLSVRNGHLVGHDLPMVRLVDFLSYQVDRVVIDKTGLTATYDVQLDWSPEDQASTDENAAAPPLFTALEQQLGLKLVSSKEPVSVLVIDSVALPSAN